MEALQTTNPPTPDTIWAILREVAESQKETDRMIKENAAISAANFQETDRIIKENAAINAAIQEETAKQIKEINKRHGDFTNSFGEMVEYMVAPNLQDRFFELGLDFPQVSNDIKIKDKKSGIAFQIDVYLESSDAGMLVEVKADLSIRDINAHIQRLEKMRKYADLRGDKRVFWGAVAGVVVKDEVREYSLDNGFYLVEPSGQTFNITPPFDKPKEW